MNFAIYAVLGLAIWGAYNKLFILPTTNSSTTIGEGGRQINVYGQDAQKVPLIGCAAWRINNEIYWKKSMRVREKEEK